MPVAVSTDSKPDQTKGSPGKYHGYFFMFSSVYSTSLPSSLGSYLTTPVSGLTSQLLMLFHLRF